MIRFYYYLSSTPKINYLSSLVKFLFSYHIYASLKNLVDRSYVSTFVVRVGFLIFEFVKKSEMITTFTLQIGGKGIPNPLVDPWEVL